MQQTKRRSHFDNLNEEYCDETKRTLVKQSIPWLNEACGETPGIVT